MSTRRLIGIAVILYIVVGLLISERRVFGQLIGRPEDPKKEKYPETSEGQGEQAVSPTIIYTSCTWAYDYREGVNANFS